MFKSEIPIYVHSYDKYISNILCNENIKLIKYI